MDVTHHSSSEPAPPVPEGAGARLQGARDAAEAVGAADVFVFRRVVGDRSVHVGGIGRGEGWAGIVELHLNDDPLAAEAHESRRPVRVASDEPTQIFGPYYAVGAALVPVSGDVMVVFGHPATELKPESDDVLRAGARRASEHLHVVAPAKRLADELELLHAVKHLMDFEGASVEEAMRHVLVTAARALSCELGALYMLEGDRVALFKEGPFPAVDDAAIRGVMRTLAAQGEDLPRCIQDCGDKPLPAPLGAGSGVFSYYLLGIGAPRSALMLLIHTQAGPRGFTKLCREIGLRLAESAQSVLAMATSRMALESEISRMQRETLSDCLTGVANRRAWEAALVSGAAIRGASVVVVDVDNLKAVNDVLGHRFGDEFLKAAAQVLTSSARDSDLVARLGGDEFGVFLRDTDEAECSRFVARIKGNVDSHPGIEGAPDFRLSLAIGWSTCAPGEDIAAAECEADAVMYGHKGARRRTEPPATAAS